MDAEAFKEQQKDNWNGLSDRWDTWHDRFETGAAAVTRRLLELGSVRPGHQVLDIGTGTGEPAITAAGTVGPDGAVLSVDQAGEMLDVARRRAGELRNIEFQVADAESLELAPESFDVVVSRWTLMFLPSPEDALRTLATFLKPGGVLVASAWTSPPEAPVISIAFGVVGRLIELPPPPPGLPGPFSMSDPDAVRDQLIAGGFAEVTHERCDAEFSWGSTAEFADFALDLLPGGIKKSLRDRFGSERAESVRNEVITSAEQYAKDDGVLVPSSSWCFRASKQ